MFINNMVTCWHATDSLFSHAHPVFQRAHPFSKSCLTPAITAIEAHNIFYYESIFARVLWPTTFHQGLQLFEVVGPAVPQLLG